MRRVLVGDHERIQWLAYRYVGFLSVGEAEALVARQGPDAVAQVAVYLPNYPAPWPGCGLTLRPSGPHGSTVSSACRWWLVCAAPRSWENTTKPSDASPRHKTWSRGCHPSRTPRCRSLPPRRFEPRSAESKPLSSTGACSTTSPRVPTPATGRDRRHGWTRQRPRRSRAARGSNRSTHPLHSGDRTGARLGDKLPLAPPLPRRNPVLDPPSRPPGHARTEPPREGARSRLPIHRKRRPMDRRPPVRSWRPHRRGARLVQPGTSNPHQHWL